MSTAAGQSTIVASQDNFVTGGSDNRDDVQGSSGTSGEILLKRASSTSGSRKAYFQFDVSSLTLNATDTATFTVNLVGTSSSTANFTFAAYALNTGFTPGTGKLGTNWTESAITWNNAPANNTGDRSAVTSDATQIGSSVALTGVTTTTTGEFEFDLGLLSNYIQADDTVTIIMTMQSQSNTSPILKFASSENATSSLHPSLSIVPEPAAASILLGLSTLAFVGLRRRR
ncbi:MAG TPA: hypothetical protein DEA90_14455 [Opitutae bacterium]|nr:hypothetical protein [Puniceicoccaceae bacterium]HBR95359.1 hypothetical protein [Opitutae bacterium]